MAMVVKNNMQAKNTLNTLNKNTNALSKSLQKVSSGMKINSAADAAAEYSISEKMRAQIRSLDQANQNTQNASSMMKVADGTLANQEAILRTMKEKAINSANDHNTDADRAMMQKELNQLADQLNDNANVTFNGKYIFNGDLNTTVTQEQKIQAALNSEWISTSLDMIEEATGLSFFSDTASVTEMNVRFIDKGTTDLGYSAAVASISEYVGGIDRTTALTLNINMGTWNKAFDDADGPMDTTAMDRVIAHEMTHAVISANVSNFDAIASSTDYLFLSEGIAEVIHGIDDERYGILNGFGWQGGKKKDDINAYTDGYIFYRFLAQQSSKSATETIATFWQTMAGEKNYAGDILKNNIGKAISAATNGKYTSLDEVKNAIQSAQDSAASKADFLKNSCGIVLGNADTGSILGGDANGTGSLNASDVVKEGGSTKRWINPTGDSTLINGLTVNWDNNLYTYDKTAPKDKSAYSTNGGTIPGIQNTTSFQVGTKAGQTINMAMAYVDAQGLGIQDKDGNTINISSKWKAKQAISQIDRSIEHVLDLHTNVGALLTRLDYTSSNIVTQSENVTASESTIRDADMAKEMTEYTKNNVLMQAAQSMLSQANQNSSNALSLLQ